jgi:hypothetical protein
MDLELAGLGGAGMIVRLNPGVVDDSNPYDIRPHELREQRR